MNVLAYLMPIAIGLGLTGLAAFFWCLRTHQFEDLEGAGWRALADDDVPARRSGERRPNTGRNL
jgi:cbb3-type cytochrome oxidase maturation protein